MSFPSSATSGNRSPSPVSNEEDRYTSGSSSPLGTSVQSFQNTPLEPETQGASSMPSAPNQSEPQDLLKAIQKPEWFQKIQELSNVAKKSLKFTNPSQAFNAYRLFNGFSEPIPTWLSLEINSAMISFEDKFLIRSSINSFNVCSNAWNMLKDKHQAEIRAELETKFNNASVLLKDQVKQLIFCYLNGGKQYFSEIIQSNYSILIKQLEARHPQAAQELSYEYCLSSNKAIVDFGFEEFARYNMKNLQSIYEDRFEDTKLEFG